MNPLEDTPCRMHATHRAVVARSRHQGCSDGAEA